MHRQLCLLLQQQIPLLSLSFVSPQPGAVPAKHAQKEPVIWCGKPWMLPGLRQFMLHHAGLRMLRIARPLQRSFEPSISWCKTCERRPVDRPQASSTGVQRMTLGSCTSCT